jgi:isocitrate/isopropylmalate dehydrogenase
MSSSRTQPVYRIASIPGDGIGPEVISAGITVLRKLASVLGTFDLQFAHFDWSSDFYKKYGRYIPEGGLEDLKKHDAIFFGAVGAPGMPLHRHAFPSSLRRQHS